jgi:hypothetical protein
MRFCSIPFLAIVLVPLLASCSSSHSMDEHDGGHESDAEHVHDASDASVPDDAMVDSRVAEASCDGTFDVGDDRRCMGGMPAAPVLVSATLVTHGTMALVWTNAAPTCTALEINRKVDAGMYAVAQSLSGQATMAQDMPGHTSGTYCYTITCKLDGVASAPSNEKCVTQ